MSIVGFRTTLRYCRQGIAVYFSVKRCEVYVIGKPTIVYTDHKPLLSLKTFKDVLNKRYTWIMYLEDVGVALRHVDGIENVVADYISRHMKTIKPLDVIRFATIVFINNLYQNDEILYEQKQDQKICQVIPHLNDSTKICAEEFKRYKDRLSIQNNVLLYLSWKNASRCTR